MNEASLRRGIIRLIAALASSLVLCGLIGCPRFSNEEIQVTVTDEGGGEGRSAPTESQLLALARREGEITLYTSISAPQAEEFAACFQARYPGIRVRLIRGGTFELADRLQREISNDQTQADVLHVLDTAIFVSLRQRGELLLYDPPEAAAVPAEYKEPGYWTGARLVTAGLAYNVQRLRTETGPKRWRDLFDPRFIGKIGLKDAQSAGSAYALYYFLRERYGQDFWQRMAAMRPKIYKTEEDMIMSLENGEISIAAGVMLSRRWESPGNVSDKIKWLLPQDGVPLILAPVAVLSRAPHPNAARLFVNYMLSREGQAALRDLVGAYPTRYDLEPPRGCPPLNKLPLLHPPAGWDEYLAKQDTLRAEYARLFQREGE